MLLEAFKHNMHTVSQMLFLSFGKDSHSHPSRLNNTLSLICLGNSALTSERLSRALRQSWRARVYPKKILSSPLWRLYTVLMLHGYGDLPKTCFQVQAREIPSPYKTLNGLLYARQWIRIFFGPHIQLAEVYTKVQTSIPFFLTNMTALHHGLWLGWIGPSFQHFLQVSPHFLYHRRWDPLKSLFKGLHHQQPLISCFARLVQPNSRGSSEKMLWYSVSRAWADVQFAPDHPSSPDKSSCWRSISFLHSIDILVHWIPCISSNFSSVPGITSTGGTLFAATTQVTLMPLLIVTDAAVWFFYHYGNMLTPSSHLGVGVCQT